MSNNPPVPIGRVVLAEPTKHRRTYETASWFTEYAVPAGEYEVVAFFYGRMEGAVMLATYWQPCASIECTVTDEFFSNRLFSAYTPDPNNGKNVGKVERIYVPIPLADVRLNDPFFVWNSYIAKRIAA